MGIPRHYFRSECMYVCVYVCERACVKERERECVCVWVCFKDLFCVFENGDSSTLFQKWVYVCMYVCMWARARERHGEIVCVCVCVCVFGCVYCMCTTHTCVPHMYPYLHTQASFIGMYENMVRTTYTHRHLHRGVWKYGMHIHRDPSQKCAHTHTHASAHTSTRTYTHRHLSSGCIKLWYAHTQRPFTKVHTHTHVCKCTYIHTYILLLEFVAKSPWLSYLMLTYIHTQASFIEMYDMGYAHTQIPFTKMHTHTYTHTGIFHRDVWHGVRIHGGPPQKWSIIGKGCRSANHLNQQEWQKLTKHQLLEKDPALRTITINRNDSNWPNINYWKRTPLCESLAINRNDSNWPKHGFLMKQMVA